MKSSKHVETCFVRANDDFDDELTHIYCFLNEKKLLDKNPQKRTLCPLGFEPRIFEQNFPAQDLNFEGD